jgi:hypothetical protein
VVPSMTTSARRRRRGARFWGRITVARHGVAGSSVANQLRDTVSNVLDARKPLKSHDTSHTGWSRWKQNGTLTFPRSIVVWTPEAMRRACARYFGCCAESKIGLTINSSLNAVVCCRNKYEVTTSYRRIHYAKKIKMKLTKNNCLKTVGLHRAIAPYCRTLVTAS